MREKTTSKTSDDRVFVVRVWREPGEASSEDDSWRGQVTHNDRRYHFVGLLRLFALIRQSLFAPNATSSQREENG
jgi:hypothetical protein